MYTEKVAIIDIGSNTIRLVIYGIDAQYNYIELQNVKTPARLSHFLEEEDGQKWMRQEGIDRLIRTLQSFNEVCWHYNVDVIRPMATAAIRQSANQEDIFAQVIEATGFNIELVQEEEEALYGQYAVTHTNTIKDAITIDIGGGSCEITLYEDKQGLYLHSFPFGAVSLKDQFFEGKAHNDPDAIAAAREYVSNAFKEYEWIRKAKKPIIAIGGSARNVANVHQLATNYPMAGIHGYEMNEVDLSDTFNLFVNTPYEEMSDIEGLSNDRTDLIIPATIVFQELMKVTKADIFSLSSQGLREGIILKYINEKYDTPIDNKLIRKRSVEGVVRDFPINTFGSDIDIHITLSLFEELVKWGQLEESAEIREELTFATILYRFGGFISTEADSQHTFYILSNMNLLGFSHYKRLRLALLASFRNRTLYKQYLETFEDWLTQEEFDLLERLGGLLKFAQALNDSKTAPIKDIRLLKADQNTYELLIYHNESIVAEKYRANRHKKHLERALDGSLKLNFVYTER